jgi:hypothetical protein
MAETNHVLGRKGSNVRNSKSILIACLAVLQLALLVQLAVAAPMAHGRFNDVNAYEFSIPGQRLDFSATAVNDGDSTGWFRICVIRVGPNLTEYFPSEFNQVYDTKAVHCSETLQTDPGGTITFESMKFLMLSVPSVTFWILLTVQQQAPIPSSEEGSDCINLTVDELREVVISNLYP